MKQVGKVSDNNIFFNEALHRKVYRGSKKEILLKERERAIKFLLWQISSIRQQIISHL